MKAFRPEFWKICLRIAALAVILTAAFFGWCALVNKLMFPSPRTGVRVGNITLVSGGARLDALWMPGLPDREVILYSHGNCDRLDTIGGLLERFGSRGYGVLAYDYAGYGGSTGQAGEEQAYSDIEAAYRFLTEDQGIDPGRIVAVGYSIGSGPTSWLAENRPVKAVVLVAPFASAAQVVLPFPIPGDHFPNADRLSRCRTPLLLFHGEADRLIPVRNGEKIYRMASGRKRFLRVPGAGHVSIFSRLDSALTDELEAFLAALAGEGREHFREARFPEADSVSDSRTECHITKTPAQ